MYSAVDIEGHKGSDGRYYLLDFSRTFPPEAPKPKDKYSHLYKMLRYKIFIYLSFIYIFIYFLFLFIFIYFLYLYVFIFIQKT